MNPFFPMPGFQSLQGQRPVMEPGPIYQPQASGYMGVYGRDPEKVSPAVSPVLEGLREGERYNESGEGGRGYSSTSYAAPGTSFDALGRVGTAAGLATGISGLGALGGAAGAYAANQTLSGLGLPANVSYGQSMLSAALGPVGGLLGAQSPQAQFDAALARGIERGIPAESMMGMLASMQGPSIAQQYGAQISSGQMSPEMGFFSSVNDLNTVGQLGEVLGSMDQSSAPSAEEGSSNPSGDMPGGQPGEGPSPGWAEGGYIPGDSGGMDDDVPAIIDGKEPARLSSGEFVFDAATVAALGDGNNQAGAKKLDGLRKAIRKKAYGHERQPPQNYSLGDLVRAYDRDR